MTSDNISVSSQTKPAEYRRRVGTFTMGISLIAGGILFFTYNLFPDRVDLLFSLSFAPLILVALGIEILIFYFARKDDKLKYDFLSALYCFFLLGVGACFTVIPAIIRWAETMYYR